LVPDGLAYNESEVDEHYGDTQGYTETNFVAFIVVAFIGIYFQSLFDRLKRVGDGALAILYAGQARRVLADHRARPDFEQTFYALPNQADTFGGPAQLRER
jgi:hypothetical protein